MPSLENRSRASLFISPRRALGAVKEVVRIAESFSRASAMTILIFTGPQSVFRRQSRKRERERETHTQSERNTYKNLGESIQAPSQMRCKTRRECSFWYLFIHFITTYKTRQTIGNLNLMRRFISLIVELSYMCVVYEIL